MTDNAEVDLCSNCYKKKYPQGKTLNVPKPTELRKDGAIKLREAQKIQHEPSKLFVANAGKNDLELAELQEETELTSKAISQLTPEEIHKLAEAGRDKLHPKAKARLEEMDAEQEAKYKEKPQIQHPTFDRLISIMAGELAGHIKDTKEFFFRQDINEIVEIKDASFSIITPHRFVSLIEKHIIPVVNYKNKDTGIIVLKTKSITPNTANIILQSEILQQELPQIERIFTIPIPIIYEDKITFAQKGYDARFKSWLPYDAPDITNPNMPLEEAKKLIDIIFTEFCFKGERDKSNAILALLTPFLRGLYPDFYTRTPLFFYIGNRERCGKDYCAGIRGIIYAGDAIEETPISTGGKSKTDIEEFRKKLLATLISGGKYMHFSNNKGHINNAVFESVLTNAKYTDRILGKNENRSFGNELEFSLSGNTGITYTADLANRSKFINLFLDIENANDRTFKNPNLHTWIKNNRSLVLSALYSLVKNWFNAGKPKGEKHFASYPDWASICGGIMESAGYENTCDIDAEISLAGDVETADMKTLFELCHTQYPNQFITKQQIKQVIIDTNLNPDATIELFRHLDFADKSAQTKFGLLILKYVGRIMSDVRLDVENKGARPARQRFKFNKEGDKNSADAQLKFETIKIN